MFDQIFKSLEVRQKYSATRRIFNSLLDFSIYQTRTTVFDIFNCQNATSSPKNKSISSGPYNYNFKCRREIKNIICCLCLIYQFIVLLCLWIHFPILVLWNFVQLFRKSLYEQGLTYREVTSLTQLLILVRLLRSSNYPKCYLIKEIWAIPKGYQSP